MAKSNLAVFAKDPETASAVAIQPYELIGAQSLADGEPLNTVLLMSAGEEGALVTSLFALARGTNTATQASIFIRKSSDPATKRTLMGTVAIAPQSITGTTQINRHQFDLASDAVPLRLGPGDELYFGIATGQTHGVVAHAIYTDF